MSFLNTCSAGKFTPFISYIVYKNYRKCVILLPQNSNNNGITQRKDSQGTPVGRTQ